MILAAARAPREDRERSWRRPGASPTPRCSRRWSTSPSIPTPIRGSFDPQLPGAAGRSADHGDAASPEILLGGRRGRQAGAALRRGDEHQRRSRGLGPARQRARAARPLQRRALLLGPRTSRRSWPTASTIWPTSPSRRSSASYLEKTERDGGAGRERTRAATTHAAARAPLLAKCDLTTEMVKEFTDLQGIVGGLYARAQGEPEAVCAGDLRPLQAGEHGGLDPAHTARASRRAGRQARHAARLLRDRPDPDGRRIRSRCAARRRAWSRSWSKASSDLPLGRPARRRRAARSSCSDRVRTTSATFAASSTTKSTPCWPPAASDLVDVEARLDRAQGGAAHRGFRAAGRQLQAHPEHSEPGRIRPATGAVDEALLEAGPGARSLRRISQRRIAGHSRSTRRWIIAALRPTVDLFFDKVLVNAPDAGVRRNRLTLLNNLLTEFSDDRGLLGNRDAIIRIGDSTQELMS